MYKFNKPINKYITAKATETEGEIWIYGDITDSKWYDEDVTPKDIHNSLKDMGDVKVVNLRVNSLGGNVFAGNSIFSILDTYRAKTGCKINAYIEGVAASMGSGIPMVADHIYMAENALLMLHKPMSVAYGNADDFQKQIDMLNKAEETLISNYMRHFTGTVDELKEILRNETWFTAEEALAVGLCDEITGAVEIAASAKGVVINGEVFSDNMIREKYKNAERGEPKNMFEYDEKLKTFGVSAEDFETMNVSAETLLGIADAGRDNFINQFGEGAIFDVNQQCVLNGEFLDAEEIKNVLGENKNADDILALAKKGAEYNPDDEKKAKAYDAMVNSAIENAIANGIRAKGDSFKEDKWRKILSNLDYEEIVDQSKEWADDAKATLNAGKKVSDAEPVGAVEDKKLINPEDYNFAV